MTDVSTMTLTDFLLARIDEDEALWGQACAGPRRNGKTHARRHLAECEAKRRIIEGLQPFGALDDMSAPEILALLALPYADHPDYRGEWRP